MTFRDDRASSGIAGLDDILGGGGFPAGQMYLIEGNPGAGKTTLGLQFLRAGAAKGERCAYVVLSETERALRRMAASHNWDLDGVDVVESNDQDADQDYTIYQPSEVELSETSRSLLGRLDAIQPARLVIDSLSEVRLIANDPLRYRRQLIALRRYFHARDLTVLLLDFQAGAGDRQLESLCHGIIELTQLAPEYGGQRRRLRVKKLRESGFRDGYHNFEIITGGLDVFPRLVAADYHRQGPYVQETLSSGVPELDQLTGGGLDRGTSTLVLGPAGAGKTTLCMQYAKAHLERGEKVAFFIFDEVPNTVVVRSAGMGLGLEQHLASKAIALNQIDPAELSPGEFAHGVRRAVEAGATMIVIDSVNGYHSAMPEEHHLSAHLHELLAFLNQQRVITLLVMTQAGLIGNVTSPLDLSYLADTVILLRYFEVRAEIRQSIAAIKRRTGPHERTIREMRLDRGGVRVGEALTDFEGIIDGGMVYRGRTAMLPSRGGEPT
jgi:circadian clock protein KaiC